MLYVESMLVGILLGTALFLLAVILTIAVVVWQGRQRAQGVAIGVDITSLMRWPVIWIAALVGFGNGCLLATPQRMKMEGALAALATSRHV